MRLQFLKAEKAKKTPAGAEEGAEMGCHINCSGALLPNESISQPM